MFYDIIIIGGGIAGIYTLYSLSKKHPNLKILLLEKYKTLGGRVSTYKDKYMTLEKGAGRFSNSNILFIQLLDELHIKHKIRKISNSVSYLPSGGYGHIMNLDDAPITINPSIMESLFGKSYNQIIKFVMGEAKMPSSSFISKVILASRFESKEKLKNQTFIQYAQKILQKQQVEFIQDTFGYSNELYIMNAYDCIQLMQELSPLNQFFSLKDGFSQVIEKMIDIIKNNKNIDIIIEKEVKNIKYNKKNDLFDISVGVCRRGGDIVERVGNDSIFKCSKVICALPKQALEKLSILKPIKKHLLDKVNSGTLCRIYSRFEKDKNGRYWFQDLPKFTTNNDLRMVIPYNLDTGVIMISYSDGEYADRWNRLYHDKDIDAVNTRIKELILESTGISIPAPKSTRFFYWKYGVGYWGIGANSEKVAEQILKPFPTMDLYICGENYSEKYQQWMEGALDTSSKILDMI